ncbi:MAG: hypothetical protein JWQ74_2502 [Marmoricola sp.]|nr:hypothetical protein [Marmoricola sp.]
MKRRAWLLPTVLVAAVLALPGPSATAATTPTVTITADKAGYTAGGSADLTIRTTGSGSGKYIQVSETFANGKTYVLLKKSSSADGVRHVEAAVAYNVTVKATIYDTYASTKVVASGTAVIKVRAKLTTASRGGGSQSGSYRVYSKGTSPTFRSSDYPSYPGKRCLKHQVQRFRDGAWRTVLTGSCKVEASNGKVDWKWAGKHASNVKFRVRATFAGDKLNRPANAPWTYVMFR